MPEHKKKNVYFLLCRDKLRAYALKEEKESELNRILRKDHKSAIYLGSPYEVMLSLVILRVGA